MLEMLEKLTAPIPNDSFLVTDSDADIDIVAPKYWRVTASLTKELHLIGEFTFLTAAKIEIFKDADVDAAGTALTPASMNGNASVSVSSVFAYDPTSSDDGTLVWTQRAQALTPCELPKMILKKGSSYFIKVTSIADNNTGSMLLAGIEKD